jgi:WD40-like Beta Propeller Repeat
LGLFVKILTSRTVFFPRSAPVRVDASTAAACLCAFFFGCVGETDLVFRDVERQPVVEDRGQPPTPPAARPMEQLPAFVPPPVLFPEPEEEEMAPPGGSASPPAAVPVEPAAAPACEAFGPFGAPEAINGLGLSGDVLGPVFSADGLTIYFSELGSDENIFSATRQSQGAEFEQAQQVANLDVEGSEEGTPFLSFDGLSLYFFSTRPGPGSQGSRDIWFAQRPSLDAEFGAATVLPAVNGPGLEHLPRLSRDELTILFVSSRTSPNAFSNLWIAQRPNRSAEFAAPMEVPGINTSVREEGFSLAPDGLTLFFASNRASDLDMELWVATRASTAVDFGAAESLVALNSTGQELDPQLSPDGSELFFSSSRAGNFQLFRAVRECISP